LAGDVAQLNWSGWTTFLDYCSKRWKNIFYVPGNHEYYKISLYTGYVTLRRFQQQYPNFIILQNKTVKLDKNDQIIEEKDDQKSSDETASDTRQQKRYVNAV
jgi:hypothetical protein